MIKLLVLLGLLAYTNSECVVPSCENVGDYIPVYDNCHEYHVCLDGLVPSDAVLTCGENETFVDGECGIPDEDYRCQPSCIPTTCETECQDDSVTLIPFSGNCSLYTVCIPGENTVTSCEGNQPYFDSVALECSASPLNCCDNDYLYCSTPYTQIPNPDDCTKYYLCLSEGIPTENDLYTCPDGQYFEDGLCIDGTC